MVAVVVLAAISVGLALVAALGLTQDPFMPGFGAALSGCSAVGVLFGRVLGGSGSAPCPACGAAIHDVERRGRVEGLLCARCHRFLRADDGALTPMNPRVIADVPLFGATLGERVEWPEGCVVCGAPVTQTLPLRLFKTDLGKSLNASAPGLAMAAMFGIGFTVTKGTRIALDAPHCHEHDDGVVLAEGGPTGFLLLFRSYVAQLAYCERSHAVPVESAATGRATEWVPQKAAREEPRRARAERPKRPLGAKRRGRASRSLEEARSHGDEPEADETDADE